jgi:acetolactate synthase-1/3 small subunit
MRPRTLSVTVENNPGVLTRVTTLFWRRGYNINSLTVGPTEVEGLSRMTVVVEGDEKIVEQVIKQLYKLIEVVKIIDISGENAVERELIMIKVKADSSNRGEITQIVNIFRARIVDVAPNTLVVEVTGDNGKISALEASLQPYGILEVIRTGKVAMVRGGS